jgi:hypothetical protein
MYTFWDTAGIDRPQPNSMYGYSNSGYIHPIPFNAPSWGDMQKPPCRSWRTSGEPSHIVSHLSLHGSGGPDEAAPSANSRERGAYASFNEDYGAASRPINP